MKQICRLACQVRLSEEDAIRYIYAGTILDMKEKHPCFDLIEEVEGELDKPSIDLGTAGEEELNASKLWKPNDLIEFAKENYKVVLKKSDKASMVAAFVDARLRSTV